MPAAAIARRRLDRRLVALRPLLREPRPPHGWIRAVRDALGMSTRELAARLGVGQSSAAELEAREAEGTIQLDTLRRAAEALGCDLVYFLVPRTSLDEAVRAQARRKAVNHLAPVAHHSRLEDQTFDDADAADQLDELAERFVDRRGLWTDEPSRS